MRQRIPIEQFAGNVHALAALAVFAGYRPANTFGVPADIPGFALGIAHYSAVAALTERLTSAEARQDALVAAAETHVDPGKVLEALAASADERESLGAEIRQIRAQINVENERRTRERTEPAIKVDEVGLAAQALAAKDDDPPTPFKSLGDQLKYVALAAINKHQPAHPGLIAINEWQANRVRAATGASELVGADGGFLVQTDLQSGLLDDVFSAAQLAPQTTRREVGAGFNGVKFNTIDETSRATGSRYGGVRAYWVAEGGQKTASRPKIKQIELTLQKLAGMYVATDELLQDTTALESFVRPAFVSEFAFVVDDAILRGTGAGEPLGILNSPALISVAALGGQGADGIEYENVLAMLGRISPTSIRNARWYMNQGIWAQLPLMVVTIGTGGLPVFLPPGAASDAPFGTLLGRPIEVIEQASAPGDVGDVIFADLKQYLLLQKGGIQSDSSIHVYFDTDETAFRWVLRVNGRPLKTTALTPYKGSATTSPFVTLAAR